MTVSAPLLVGRDFIAISQANIAAVRSGFPYACANDAVKQIPSTDFFGGAFLGARLAAKSYLASTLRKVGIYRFCIAS